MFPKVPKSQPAISAHPLLLAPCVIPCQLAHFEEHTSKMAPYFLCPGTEEVPGMGSALTFQHCQHDVGIPGHPSG